MCEGQNNQISIKLRTFKMTLTQEMSLTQEIRQCTYAECILCKMYASSRKRSLVDKMCYLDGYYRCEICERNVDINDEEVGPELLLVDWDKFRSLVENSTSPKSVISTLLNRIFHIEYEYTEEDIEQYYIDLMDHGSFSIMIE